MTLRAISFNREIYRRPLEVSGDRAGYNIQLFLPPTDIPDYIKTDYNEKNDCVNIIFCYPNEERESELFRKDNLRLLVASYSGKPLRIEVKNVKKDKIDKIRLTNIIKNDLREAIKQKVSHLQNERQRKYLENFDEVLDETADEMAECALA